MGLDKKQLALYVCYAIVGLYLLLVSSDFKVTNPDILLIAVSERPYVFVTLMLVYFASTFDIGLGCLLSMAVLLTRFDLHLVA